MSGKSKVIIVACFLAVAGVAKADLINPGFDDQLNGWTLGGGGLVSVTSDADGPFAILQEAGSPGQPALSELFQDFVIGSGDGRLSFEYAIASSGTFNHSALPDAFTARLLDPATGMPLLSSDGVSDYFYHDARAESDSIRYAASLVTFSDSASRSGWHTVSLDLASLPIGSSARLSLGLLGTGLGDGQLTFAAVDSFALEPIPAPMAVVLGVIGLTGVGAIRGRRS